jgi:hypothetical protein
MHIIIIIIIIIIIHLELKPWVGLGLLDNQSPFWGWLLGFWTTFLLWDEVVSLLPNPQHGGPVCLSLPFDLSDMGGSTSS